MTITIHHKHENKYEKNEQIQETILNLAIFILIAVLAVILWNMLKTDPIVYGNI